MTDNTDTHFPAIAEAPIGEATIQTVDGRELHAFLEVGRDFTNWIKDRIAQYGFVEGLDYVILGVSANSGENLSGGRPRTEYHLSLDMAKELSMVERNERGKQARLYFIECERRAKAGPDPVTLLNDPAAMRGILLSYTEKVIELEGRVAEMQPQVQALERIAVAEGSLCITDAAKTLQVRPKVLFDFLRSHRWIYTRPGASHDIAYQDKLASGLMEHKSTTVLRSDGSEKVTTQARVTPKGLARLGQLLPPVAQLISPEESAA